MEPDDAQRRARPRRLIRYSPHEAHPHPRRPGSLPRYDATRLTARLQSEFERELQATAATSAAPLDAQSHRAALDRARHAASSHADAWHPSAGMGSRRCVRDLGRPSPTRPTLNSRLSRWTHRVRSHRTETTHVLRRLGPAASDLRHAHGRHSARSPCSAARASTTTCPRAPPSPISPSARAPRATGPPAATTATSTCSRCTCGRRPTASARRTRSWAPSAPRCTTSRSTLTGHRLINLRHEFSEARRDPDGETTHGIARFRAVTEPSE